MFGLVVADIEALSGPELERYRGCYCGLCRTLGRRHGPLGRLTLNYDLTFLVLLLSSLYEPQETAGQARCPLHPRSRRPDWRTRFTDYAADLNIALSYYKCLDDWQDDHRLGRLAAARLLEPRWRRVQQAYPGQCRAIRQCFQDLAEIEKSQVRSTDTAQNAARNPSRNVGQTTATRGVGLIAGPDAAPNRFGQLMGELLAAEAEERWSGTLRETGLALGRFIYLMDACLDLESDRRHGTYNPLAATPAGDNGRDYEDLLTLLIGDCTRHFEKLPLVQDIALLRNILYSGVWQKYRLAAARAAKKGKKP